MLKRIFLLIMYVVSISFVEADENFLFCNNEASRKIKDLNTTENHEEALYKILKFKEKYNTLLAEDTVSAGVKALKDKYIEKSDYSSALLLEMIIAKVAKPSAQTFDELCMNNESSIKLCSLDTDKRKIVSATFVNFKLACAQTVCSQNLEIKNINIDQLASFIEAQKSAGNLPQDAINGLTPTTSDALPESPERNKIRSDIEVLQTKTFQDTEKLKRFIGEKYLRSCSQTAPLNEIHSSCGASGVPAIMNLQIVDDSFNIVGSLSKQQGESSTFSKAEIKSYKEICDRNNNSESFKSTCVLVNREYEETKTVKEPKDWDEIRKNNYVDSDGKGGYKITPKTSTTALLLGGIAPAIANFAPFWMWNMQMQSQIDIMTMQAMYNAQYGQSTYTTNPYGYFQGNYMPMYTPPTSPGFNFSL